jgi:hypothetical protein
LTFRKLTDFFVGGAKRRQRTCRAKIGKFNIGGIIQPNLNLF